MVFGGKGKKRSIEGGRKKWVIKTIIAKSAAASRYRIRR